MTVAAHDAPCASCGCTPTEPCEVAHRRPPGRVSDDPALAMVQRAKRYLEVRETCSFDRRLGICTRCMRAGQMATDLNAYRSPTVGQLCELERIRARHGDNVHVRGGAFGSLVVTLDLRPRPVILRR